jgi:hypothetical protein
MIWITLELKYTIRVYFDRIISRMEKFTGKYSDG